MNKHLWPIFGMLLWSCFGGSEDEPTGRPTQYPSFPRDGYYFYGKSEFMGRSEDRYFGFFGGKRVEIVELEYDESDSAKRVLEGFKKIHYDVLSSTTTLRFRIKEGRDTVSDTALDLGEVCPIKLEPIGTQAIRTMDIRNPTDSSIEVRGSTDWRIYPKIDLVELIGSCASAQ